MKTKKSSITALGSTMRNYSIPLVFALLCTCELTAQTLANPSLAWATYYGGNDFDQVNAIATDRCGNVYITGRTHSSSDIATAGAHQAAFGGYADAF